MSSKNEAKINRKVFIVNLFGLVGLLMTFIMGVIQYFNQDYILSAILLTAAGFYALSHYVQKRAGNTVIASMIMLYTLFILMVYLVYCGGDNNTGPVWIFIVPAVALFINGLKRGSIDIAVFVIVISVLFFYPNDALLKADYSFEFKTRLLLSFLTVSVLSALYEYSRQAALNKMMVLSTKYEQMAKTDPLTHLSNRRAALDRLQYAKNRLARNKEKLCVILCDVDHFKLINDNYGHNVGDEALIKLATLFTENIRQQDDVARWGGEEFIFILPDTSLAQAKAFSQKIHDALSHLVIPIGNQQLTLTVSMGISEVITTQPLEHAIKVADEYMYQAKAAGRNQTFPINLNE